MLANNLIVEKTKTFEPGIYDSITNDEYHSSPGLSRSAIMEFKKSPKHFQHKYLNPDYKKPEPSAPMQFGTALHTALLEPKEFYNRVIIKPEEKILIGKLPLLKDVGRLMYDQAKLQQEQNRIAKEAAQIAFEIESAGKIILTFEEKKKLDSMCEAIYSDEYAKDLLVDAIYERSIYWIDPETQLLLKARPDIWHDAFIVDYKTCADASERSFGWEVKNYGYYMQFAMMNEAIKNILGIDMRDFVFLAQEKTEPYLPAIYQLNMQSLDKGIEEFHHLLREIKSCMESNKFVGYSPKFISI